MSELTVERALKITATVAPRSELDAGIMSPMAGIGPVKLESLVALERFLKPITEAQVRDGGPQVKIHHVDPDTMINWVRETIGDPELADALHGVLATGEVYGKLVPQFKQLVADRLAECTELLEPPATEEG